MIPDTGAGGAPFIFLGASRGHGNGPDKRTGEDQDIGTQRSSAWAAHLGRQALQMKMVQFRQPQMTASFPPQKNETKTST